MYCNRFGSVADLLGECDAWGRVMPSICCVKSRSRFVVSSEPLFGVRRLRGVGEGDREDDRRLREVEGAGPASRPGVRVMSPRLVGLWPSFANMVISGISEKVLKHVSSTLVVSGPCIVDARESRPAWNNEGVLAIVGSARSKSRVAVRGVVCVDCTVFLLGVLLGVLRAEGVGGGMIFESALPLLSSVPFSSIAGDLIDLIEPGVVIFLGERSSFVTVACSCGTFSLSSMKSVKSMIEASSAGYDFCGVETSSSIAPSAMFPSDGLCCLLGLLLLASISLWKGDDGGPSMLNTLSSTGWLTCIDGDSMIVCGGGWVDVVCAVRRGPERQIVLQVFGGFMFGSCCPPPPT